HLAQKTAESRWYARRVRPHARLVAEWCVKIPVHCVVDDRSGMVQRRHVLPYDADAVPLPDSVLGIHRHLGLRKSSPNHPGSFQQTPGWKLHASQASIVDQTGRNLTPAAQVEPKKTREPKRPPTQTCRPFTHKCHTMKHHPSVH